MRRRPNGAASRAPCEGRMFKLIDQFRRSRSGATSVEYAILATCIALVIIVAVSSLGTRLNTSYIEVSSAFK
jgi:pilus assembly protein Flp/PilA